MQEGDNPGQNQGKTGWAKGRGSDYMGSKNKAGRKILSGPNRVCPQRGPYEASEGIYPVMGNGKKWGRE